MIVTKRYWVLISLLIILLAGTSIYFGWTKQKSELAESQPEQINSEPMKQIIISSLLDPDDVMAQFAPYIPPWGEKLAKDDPFWKQRFGITKLNEGFINGFTTAWYGSAYYLTKDGKKLGGDPHSYVLELSVLKYKNHNSAQEDYIKISTEQDFEDIIFEGLKLKSKLGIPPGLKSGVNSEAKYLQQYFLHSNNFIIYAFGLKEAAEDVMIRVIDRYEVK